MTFLCLSRIALSHFLNTLYANMDSISNLMASYLLLYICSKLKSSSMVSSDDTANGMSLLFSCVSRMDSGKGSPLVPPPPSSPLSSLLKGSLPLEAL